MIRLGVLARNNITNGVVDSIDSNVQDVVPSPDVGLLEIYEGTRPAAAPYVATAETLLATLEFSNPAFDASGAAGGNPDGQAVANTITAETSAVAGTAAWFKILSRSTNTNGQHTDDRRVVLDGIITTIGGGGDIEFDDVAFSGGGTVLINSILMTTPEECPPASLSGSLSASVWEGGP